MPQGPIEEITKKIYMYLFPEIYLLNSTVNQYMYHLMDFNRFACHLTEEQTNPDPYTEQRPTLYPDLRRSITQWEPTN